MTKIAEHVFPIITLMVNERAQQEYLAAEMYYIREMGMEAIARELEVSRPTVSRLLKSARHKGIVQISLNDDLRPRDNLESQISQRFQVAATVVRTSRTTTAISRMQQTSAAGAQLFDSLILPGTIAGVAWGSTVSEVARHLTKRPVSGVTIVQLNGAGSAMHTGIPYSGALLGQIAEVYGGNVVHFPVPAFFDYAETKRMMWQERSVRAVLQLQRTVDVALFGIGALGGEIPSHVYSSGYFDAESRQEIIGEGIVGDICTVMLKEGGVYRDLDINQRASGPTPAELKKIKRRIAVASGLHRTRALRSALLTGAITDLVVDTQLAEALLRG